MTIYHDKDYKCHVEPADGLTPIDDPFFDGKCATFIEGHRLVPAGESWTREDGKVFTGKMIAPWKPLDELEAAQREYERQLLVTYAEALKTVGVVL